MMILYYRAEGIKCPNANCPDSKPEIVYIQYDKENMKFIYVCLSSYSEKIEPHICGFNLRQ